MSVKIALLKSNEEVICEMKEVLTDDNKLAFYSFTLPYVVKIDGRKYIEEEDDGTRLWAITYTPWVMLSHDREFYVNPDWIVTVYNPTPEMEASYTERINGRLGNDGHDGTIAGGDGGKSSDSDQTDPS